MSRCFQSLIDSSNSGVFLRFAVKSTNETLGVGTRIDVPSSLPFISGITKPMALAAPVDVGIMLTAAERARRKSL